LWRGNLGAGFAEPGTGHRTMAGQGPRAPSAEASNGWVLGQPKNAGLQLGNQLLISLVGWSNRLHNYYNYDYHPLDPEELEANALFPDRLNPDESSERFSFGVDDDLGVCRMVHRMPSDEH
jgi:hypothetical protein